MSDVPSHELYSLLVPLAQERLIVPRAARRKLKGQILAHGMGRHAPEEIVALGTRSIDAIADFLAGKPYMMGDDVTALDATAFAFTAGSLCPRFETPLRAAVEGRHNLKRYAARMAERFYPDETDLARWLAEAGA